MATYSSEWQLKLIDSISAPLRSISSALSKPLAGFTGLNKAFEHFGKSQLQFNQVSMAASNFAAMMDMITEPGRKFEVSQKALQAITDVTDEKLEKISGNARKLAKIFGGDAAQGMDAFSQVLSDLGPHLAKDENSLYNIGKAAFILSKQLDNDVKAAQGVLNQSLMNFGKNLEDPTAAAKQMGEMMNIMSKAAADGAVTLPGIEKVVRDASVSAKLAGINFLDFNAAIQAAGEMNPAQLGTSLSRLFSGMQTARDKGSIQRELKDIGVNMTILTSKSAPLYDRISEIKKITQSKNSTSLLNTLFGEDGIKSALYLVEDMERLREGAGGIRDSIVNHQNDALRQASVVMDSDEEKMARRNARVRNFAISLFEESKAWIPYISGISSGIAALGHLPSAFEFLKSTKGFIGALFAETGQLIVGGVKGSIGGLVQIASSGGDVIKRGMQAASSGMVAAIQKTSAFMAVFRTNPGATMQGFFSPIARGFQAAVSQSRAAILWTKGFLNTFLTNPSALVRAFFTPLLAGFSSLKNSIVATIVRFYTFMTTLSLAQVKTALWSGIVSIATGIQWLWNTALSMNPIGLFIIAIGGLTAGMIYLYKHSETVRNIFASIGEVIGWVWVKIKSFFSFILDKLGGLLSPIADFLGISAPKLEMPTADWDENGLSGGFLPSLIPPSKKATPASSGGTYDKIDVGGEKGGAGTSHRNVIVNFMSNSVQVMQNATFTTVGESQENIRRVITEVVVASIRDAEIIASN